MDAIIDKVGNSVSHLKEIAGEFVIPRAEQELIDSAFKNGIDLS